MAFPEESSVWGSPARSGAESCLLVHNSCVLSRRRRGDRSLFLRHVSSVLQSGASTFHEKTALLLVALEQGQPDSGILWHPLFKDWFRVWFSEASTKD